MNYLINFSQSATLVEITDWLVSNNITSHSKITSSTDVYLVESEIAPIPNDIVESIAIDVNISNQLLGAVEIIPASVGATASFDHNSDWWKTASAYEVDFDADTSTFVKHGAKTTVYIVDSGVQTDHIEFQGIEIHELFSFNGDHSDTNGHGTAIASVISGNTLGITESIIKAVKVFDNTKTTMTSDLVTAFDMILTDMLANPQSVSIVNLSWSIPKNPYIESMIQKLIDAGAFVVAAAGNNGTPIQDVTPASMEAVFTIGAYTDTFVPADFSNYTSDIKTTPNDNNFGALDGWAPGVNIKVAVASGGLGMVSGTSIAAGIMSACLAYNSDMLYSHVGHAADIAYFLKATTLLKSNLLTLDAPYAASINALATFTNVATNSTRYGTYTATRIAYGNCDMHGLLAINAVTSKIELDKPLPDGLSLSNGWLVGRLTNPPVDATVTIEYQVTVTFITGEVNAFALTLHLAKSDTPPNDVPADLTLLYVCGFASCVGQCGSWCFSCEKGQTCYCDQDCR